MALDFHIDVSKSEAAKSSPDLSLQDVEHRGLATEWTEQSHPFLCRISDYYSDATYQSHDVGKLLNELSTLDRRNTVVCKLIALCSKALKLNANIYVFCD